MGELKNYTFEEFEQIVYESGLFLNPNFNIDNLAINFGVQTYIMSDLLRAKFSVSFPDFKNMLRIKYALIKIKDGILDHQTIESLALQSGFKSRSQFSRSFSEFTGISIKEVNKFRNKFFFGSNDNLIFLKPDRD
jgi:AraC-like DNA-binding protein